LWSWRKKTGENREAVPKIAADINRLAEPGSIYFSPTRLAVLKIYYFDVFPDRLEGLLNSAPLFLEEWDRIRKDFVDSLLYIKKKYKNIYSAIKTSWTPFTGKK
jgi:hypothetical protein